MARPSQHRGITRLATALQRPMNAAALRRILFHQDVDRALFLPTYEPAVRLGVIAQLRALAAYAPQPPAVITDIMTELDRMALRILSAEGLLQDPPETGLPLLRQAEVLLELAANGALPRGPVGLMAVARAQRLIVSPRNHASLREDQVRRERLLSLLDAARAQTGTWVLV